MAQTARKPSQIRIVGGQDMGLGIVKVLDAVFKLAQKHIGLREPIRRLRSDQPSACQLLQPTQSGTSAHLRKLPAAHHQQQLHQEFDFANPTAR